MLQTFVVQQKCGPATTPNVAAAKWRQPIGDDILIFVRCSYK